MAQPCKECGRRPKYGRRSRCYVCWLRHEPIDAQVEAAQRRLAMVPEPYRVKRTKAITELAPDGTAWCAGCQTFRDFADFGKGATRCRACTSATTHAARVEKVYGIDAAEYKRLLDLQGGKCAICRSRPKSKRLAVDHDHQTGEVRGLLCSRCNHDLMGSAWDSSAMALALWWYMHEPPRTGNWRPPESGLEAPERADTPKVAQRPDFVTKHGQVATHGAPEGIELPKSLTGWMVAGSARDPEKGRYLVYVKRDPDAPAPF